MSKVNTPAICDRCKLRKAYDELRADGNSPGLRVCEKCWDPIDPWRLAPRRTEDITLRHPRPDIRLDDFILADDASIAPPPPLPPPPLPPGGVLVFEEPFDTLTVVTTRFSTETDGTGAVAPSLVVHPTDSGKVLSATNSGAARRSEVTIKNGLGSLFYDNEYIITFKTYINTWDFVTPPSWFAFNQYHAVPHAKANGLPDWTCVAGRNPVTLTIYNGNYTVNVNNSPGLVAPSGALDVYLTATSQPMVIQTWVSWELRIIPSLTAGGVIQVWKDGILLGERFGRNVDLNDKCGFPLQEYVYFKAGIYKTTTNTTTQNILFDDFKIVAIN